MLTLGSLFDGAGTFPFAAQQCGVKAVWASEIESFPIEVTKKRFPEMKHLGDITKVDGAEIEPVDIVTFGSPCQDLSVAGKRAGLDGERSGLFMEAVRIIKEMRCKTNGRYPSIAIWENVPGAFSSNKGEDFRTVLEELCKIKRSDTLIPKPPKRGGRNAWNDAGLIVGDGFSIAWRVLDAQFWGVPQRRRRIFLVADFRGQCAGEILFEREGLSRSFAESRKAWKGITHSLACGSDAKVWDARGNGDGRTCPTITGDHNNRITDYTTLLVRERYGCEGGGKGVLIQENKSGTISCNNDQFLVITDADLYNQAHSGNIVNCLNVDDIGEARANEIIVMATQQGGAEIGHDLCPTITAAAGTSGNNQPVICYALDRSSFNQGINAQYDIGIDDSGIAQTLVAKGPGAVCSIVCLGKVEVDLRRLTPTECGRLQGMPDWWCEDVPHSDSAEYKMWGNGMALPCVLYVMENVVSVLSLRLLDSLLEVTKYEHHSVRL
jgi:DNA (cytosine-5)-methyltransferase 1